MVAAPASLEGGPVDGESCRTERLYPERVESCLRLLSMIVRPSAVHKYSSGGTEWERRRSGVGHLGFGTRWRADEAIWAGEHALHNHVNQPPLLSPALVIEGGDNSEHVVVKAGRHTVLDGQDVRQEAREFGNPDELLSANWTLQIPGVTVDGDYAEFSANQAAWICNRDRPVDPKR